MNYADKMAERSEIHVSRATEGDLNALKEILQETYTETWLPNLTTEAARAHETANKTSAYVDERGLHCWVAKHRDQALGLVDFDGNFVIALHVRPSCARRGIGSRLMDRAESEIRKAGFTTARLETDTFNLDSQSFYKNREYHEIDRYPDEEWHSGFTTLLLEKILV